MAQNPTPTNPISPHERVVIDHIKPSEGGDINFPYLDTKGNPTVGPGFLSETRDKFDALNLWVRGPNGQPLRPATPAEKTKAFQTLDQIKKQGGLPDGKGGFTFNVSADRYEKLTGVMMPTAEIDQKMLSVVQGKMKLAEQAVGTAAWNRLNDQQKAVLVDVAYANKDIKAYTKLIKAAQEVPPNGDAMAMESLFGDRDPKTGKITQRNWDRVLRNHVAASGKTEVQSAQILYQYFIKNGETPPSTCRISQLGSSPQVPHPPAKPPQAGASAPPPTSPPQTAPPLPSGVQLPFADPTEPTDAIVQAPAAGQDLIPPQTAAASPGDLGADLAALRQAAMQPPGPVAAVLLKPIQDWTEDDAKTVMRDGAYGNPSHRDFAPIRDKVRGWFDHAYGTEPARHDGTGRMIEPMLRPVVPTEPRPIRTAEGQSLKDALAKAVGGLTARAGKIGTVASILDLQHGLNLVDRFSDGSNKTSPNRAPLQTDGQFGPKTRAAFQARLVDKGPGAITESQHLGAFRRAVGAADTLSSPERLDQAVRESIAPLYTRNDPKPGTAHPWNAALQQTVNQIANGPSRAANDDGFAREGGFAGGGRSGGRSGGGGSLGLKEDGVIGPKTLNGVRSALQAEGPDRFLARFAGNLGLL